MDKTTLSMAAINRAITDLRFLRDVGYDGDSKEVIRNMFQGAIDVLVACADAFNDVSAEPVTDMVNEPPHYMQHAMECIDEMVEVFGVKAVKSYCKCAAWKYRYRAPYKGKLDEDNAKADWYLKKLSELNATSIFENEPDDI